MDRGRLAMPRRWLRHRRAALPRLGVWLRAVERFEKTGEGLRVARKILPPAKVPDHFAHHIGLAGVVPLVEQVIVNADGEQRVLMFAVFLLQGALDFANHGHAFERWLGADHHQLVIMPDGGVNLTPHRLTPLGIFVELPTADVLRLQVSIKPLGEVVVFWAGLLTGGGEHLRFKQGGNNESTLPTEGLNFRLEGRNLTFLLGSHS